MKLWCLEEHEVLQDQTQLLCYLPPPILYFLIKAMHDAFREKSIIISDSKFRGNTNVLLPSWSGHFREFLAFRRKVGAGFGEEQSHTVVGVNLNCVY